MQLHRKQQDEQNGQPKIGQSQTDLAEGHHAHIARGVLFGGGIKSQAQSHQHRQAHGHHGQGQGDVHALQHEHGGRCVIGNTDARLALQQTTCPLQVAGEGGLVQTQLFFHGRQRFGGGCFAQNDLCRIAGQPFQHPEDHNRGHRQRDEKTEQALDYK